MIFIKEIKFFNIFKEYFLSILLVNGDKIHAYFIDDNLFNQYELFGFIGN